MSMTKANPPRNTTTSANPAVSDEHDIRCTCNKKAIRLTSQTPANPGREFYACAKERDDPNRCRFFKWVDQISGPGVSADPSSVTPKPSQKQPPTGAGSPSKRPREEMPSASAAAADAAEARRLAAIKQGIESKQPLFVPSDDSDVEIVNSGEESPKKKFKFMPPGSSQTAATLTPGRPTQGKTPQSTAQKKSQWQKIQDDPENPFHERSASLHGTPAKNSLSTVSESPSASTSLAQFTEAFETLKGLPVHLQRLERKLLAAEKSRDSKKTRIDELEKEVKQLKERNRALEVEIESLKAR